MDSNGVAPGDDGGLGLQVIANSIVLASFVSQVVVLVTFIPDLQVFPVSLRVLSLVAVGFSMLSALAVFVSNNYACNPVVGIGCTLFLIGSLGKWLTYALRIWMLTYRRNIVLLVLMGISILLTTASFQWWCSSVTTLRVAPRLCAPLDNPFTDRLSSGAVATLNLLFIALHVYYMRDFFRDAIRGKRDQNGGFILNPSENKRLHASLQLFASSILVMLWDVIQYILKGLTTSSSSANSDPLLFFAFVYGGQILSDLIYCTYMRRFANEQHHSAKQEQELAAAPVYPTPSAGYLRERYETNRDIPREHDMNDDNDYDDVVVVDE